MSVKRTLKLLVVGIVLLGGYLICLWLVRDRQGAIFYQGNLRSCFFAGFLTVGGFLMSLQTFIIVKMKEGVYDHPRYRKRYDDRKKLNSEIALYQPLKNLNTFLFWSIFSSVVASVFQVTFGLSDSPYFASLCIWSALVTLVLLIISIFLLKMNLSEWFGFIEEDADKCTQTQTGS